MQSRGRVDIVMVLIEGHEVQVTKDQQQATLASACLYRIRQGLTESKSARICTTNLP